MADDDEVRPNGTDAKTLYENLDVIAGNLGSDELTAEILMTIMGLVWQPGNYGAYVLSPDLRDLSSHTMRRWLVDHGFLPAPRNRPRNRLQRHPDDVG